MSKRITLTDSEIWHIVKALEATQDDQNSAYKVTKHGVKVLQDIIEKLKRHHDKA